MTSFTGSESTLKVLAEPGSLPPPRSGNVAYFANLSCMFFDNEELTEELRQRVTTLDSYGGRLLPIIALLWDGQQNLLLMERRPLDLFQEYFGSELRLCLPRLFIYDPHLPPPSEAKEAIRHTPACHLDGFVTDERIATTATQTASRLASSVAGSRIGNDKVLLHRFLKEAGEPVFESIEVASPSEVAAAAAELGRRGYRFAAAKSAIGASGIGLVQMRTDAPASIPESHFRDGPCLIEGWLDESTDRISHVASPSVQIIVTEHIIHLYDITDQILGVESVHEGNISPPESFSDPSLEEELMRQAGLAARWLHRQGYRGTASADFHLAFLHNGEIEVRLCELNARVTGATYPSLLARHFLPEGSWLMRNLRLPVAIDGNRILNNLDSAGLLYRHDARKGILPINFNLDEAGLVCKGQFLFMGHNLLEVRELVSQALSLEGLTFDRD